MPNATGDVFVNDAELDSICKRGGLMNIKYNNKSSKMCEIVVSSSLDDTMQPSLLYKTRNKKRPLLVGLHTWSFNRFNQIDNMLPYSEKYDFNLLLPEFRGENLSSNPNRYKACGSEYAMRDIYDATKYVGRDHDIDTDNIFLLGLSGGGHMAMMMAAFYPKLFKAIGAFVPISDLSAWAHQNDYYRKHILACCEGNILEMKKRSPISYIDEIAKTNLKIFHGKYDNIVPVTQSYSFYTELTKKYPNASVYLDIFDGDMRLIWSLHFCGLPDSIQRKEGIRLPDNISLMHVWLVYIVY